MNKKSQEKLLLESSALHRHLCPRQVLGVRMGMYAGNILGLSLPQSDKRLLTVVEIDGCFSDGIAVATNCWVGHRTLRIQDFGKIAATFIDTSTKIGVRIFPSPNARQLASEIASESANQWEAYLLGYQRILLSDLFIVRTVALAVSIERILSKPDYKIICDSCGEEVFNEREMLVSGKKLCQACAVGSYYIYVPLSEKIPMSTARGLE